MHPAAVAAIARSCSVQLFVCRRWLVLYCALNYFCVLTPRKVTVGSEVVRAPVYSPFAGPFNSFPSMLLGVHSNVRSVRLCLLLSGCKVLGLVYRQVVWLPGHAGSSPVLLFIDKTHSAPVACPLLSSRRSQSATLTASTFTTTQMTRHRKLLSVRILLPPSLPLSELNLPLGLITIMPSLSDASTCTLK